MPAERPAILLLLLRVVVREAVPVRLALERPLLLLYRTLLLERLTPVLDLPLKLLDANPEG